MLRVLFTPPGAIRLPQPRIRIRPSIRFQSTTTVTPKLVLFSGPTCSLCDTAKEILHDLEQENDWRLDIQTIDIHAPGQEKWKRRYVYRIPVLHLEDKVVEEGRWEKEKTLDLISLLTRQIGPITVMPQFLKDFPEVKDKTIQGTLVATILMAAAISSITSGSVSDKISRKRTIMIGSLITAVGCFIEASSVKLWMLILGRLIAGFGEGWFLSTISVYLIETSPPSVRGRTACMLQLFITIGIAVGYFTCFFSVSMPSSFSFRIPFIIQGIVCLVLALGVPFMPYSPRWLVTKGRGDEAWEVLAIFDKDGANLQREKIEESIRRENQLRGDLLGRNPMEDTDDSERYVGACSLGACGSGIKKNEHIAAVAETFSDGPRGRTIFGIALLGLQQMSGIDAVLFYAPVLFSQAGLSSQKASFLASGVSGIVNFLCTIPAQFVLMDRWGRRPCCITGGLVMAVCMILIGSMYASGKVYEAGGRWVVVSTIYIFIATFAVTWAVAGKILTTEMQPTRTRATAASLAQTSNWLVNVVVALTTPTFLSKSPSGPYFMFGGFLCAFNFPGVAELVS
ncbi:general substrate transporter [Serendipita vermifera]|nr:general substrate transporter [Serendipita vermifera]